MKFGNTLVKHNPASLLLVRFLSLHNVTWKIRKLNVESFAVLMKVLYWLLPHLVALNNLFCDPLALVISDLLAELSILLRNSLDESLVDNSRKLFRKGLEWRLRNFISYPLVNVNKPISARITRTSSGFFEHNSFIFYCNFVVIKSQPQVSVPVVNKCVIMPTFSAPIMYQNSVQIICVVLQLRERQIDGSFQFIYLL